MSTSEILQVNLNCFLSEWAYICPTQLETKVFNLLARVFTQKQNDRAVSPEVIFLRCIDSLIKIYFTENCRPISTTGQSVKAQFQFKQRWQLLKARSRLNQLHIIGYLKINIIFD